MKVETKAEKIIRQEIEKWSILKPTTMAKDIMKALNEANLIFVKRNVIKSVCPNCGTGKENHAQMGNHVHCRECDYEWNWG